MLEFKFRTARRTKLELDKLYWDLVLKFWLAHAHQTMVNQQSFNGPKCDEKFHQQLLQRFNQLFLTLKSPLGNLFPNILIKWCMQRTSWGVRLDGKTCHLIVVLELMVAFYTQNKEKMIMWHGARSKGYVLIWRLVLP